MAAVSPHNRTETPDPDDYRAASGYLSLLRVLAGAGRHLTFHPTNPWYGGDG